MGVCSLYALDRMFGSHTDATCTQLSATPWLDKLPHVVRRRVDLAEAWLSVNVFNYQEVLWWQGTGIPMSVRFLTPFVSTPFAQMFFATLNP
jgi:hypothetical protein